MPERATSKLWSLAKGPVAFLVPLAVFLGMLGMLVFFPFWDDFLGPGDFHGSPIAPPPGVVWSAPATYNGHFTFTNVDVGLIKPLLPPGWVLAQRSTSGNAGLHPVAVAFGDQTDSTLLTLFGSPTPTGLHYSEMVLAIPFVQLPGKPGWHLFMVRLYADNDAVIAPAAAYGFPKLKGWLWWSGWKIAVQTPLRADLVTGSFRTTSAWWTGSEALIQLSRFDEALAMWTTRVLGVHPLTGVPVCSFFDWDLSDAQVSRALTSHRFVQPLTSGMSGWPALGDLSNTYRGAFAVQGLRGRLSQPLPCL